MDWEKIIQIDPEVEPNTDEGIFFQLQQTPELDAVFESIEGEKDEMYDEDRPDISLWIMNGEVQDITYVTRGWTKTLSIDDEDHTVLELVDAQSREAFDMSIEDLENDQEYEIDLEELMEILTEEE